MNRRQFFKRTAVVCATGTAVAAKPVVAGAEDRSVVYGVACDYYKKGWIAWWNGTRWQDCWNYNSGTICLECIGDIEPGQKIRWFPNGTIMGVKKIERSGGKNG